MLLLVILLSQAEHSFGIGTMGTEFLISLPGMLVNKREEHKFPGVSMYLLSLEFITKVHMRTHWYDRANGNLKQVLYIEKGLVTKFTLPPDYLYGLSSGTRWSIHFLSHLSFSVTVELFHNFKSSATFQLLPVAAWGEIYFAVTLGYRPVIIVTTVIGPNKVRFKIKARYPRRLIIDTGVNKLIHGSVYETELNPYMSYALSVCDNDAEVGPITGTEIKGQFAIGVVSGNCYSGTDITYCDGGPVDELGSPDILAATLSAIAQTCVVAHSVVQRMKRVKYSDGNPVDEFGGPDILAEMLTPSEAYGSDFITFDTLKRPHQGHYVFVASARDTRVTVYEVSENKSIHFFLKFRGNWKSMQLHAQRIYTTQPIQLVLIQESPCLKIKETNLYEEGGPSMSIIVPTNLFYFEYTWGTPYELGDHHFIILVVRATFIEYFVYNGARTSFKMRWQEVYDTQVNDLWLTGLASVLSSHQHLLYNPKTSFGCYLYGFNKDSAYMHPAGYIAAHINTYCYNSVKEMKVDDLIDNDCDLRVDEEFDNDIDDDHDRLIDEDLRSDRYIPTHATTRATSSVKTYTPYPTWSTVPINATTKGRLEMSTLFAHDTNTSSTLTSTTSTTTQSPSKFTDTTRPSKVTATPTTIFSLQNYTQWSIWQCDENCYESRQKRTRRCFSNECTDQEIQWREHGCYVNEICPQMCGEYTWGINCGNSCANCLGDCDKFSGSCKLCMPFYTSPQNGCLTLIVGVWQGWKCSNDCKNSNQFRERICQKSLNDCTTIEWRNASCHTKICPKDCSHGSWGTNCTFSCSNCENDCDKFNGTCERCKAGYKNPKSGCVEDCDRFTYGRDCSLSCSKKCDSDDCAERVTGLCPVHGGYGEWTSWRCTRNCLDHRMYRERSCDQPPPKLGGLQCQGPWQAWKDSKCFSIPTKLCPSDCPEYLWGVDCESSCANCMSDCDKFYGNCTRCKKGFKYPDRSCTRACDFNEYGYDCAGNCHKKCGSDCKERVHGYCKDPSTILLAAVFGFFAAILIVVCLVKRNMASDNSSRQSED